MKVKEVNYQTMFPIAPYLNDRVGVVFELEPGEEMEDALNKAKERVHEWHKQANPHLYQDKKKTINLLDVYKECDNTDIEVIKDRLNKSIAASAATPDHTFQSSSPIEKRSNSIADQLNTCTDLISLECYKLIVKGKPDLQKAYDTKMKELSK